MITAYLGEGSKAEFLRAVSNLKNGAPEHSVDQFDEESPLAEIQEAFSAGDLFGTKHTVVLKNIFQGREEEKDKLQSIILESQHDIMFFEFEHDNRGFYKTLNATIIEPVSNARPAYETTTVFSLADAYAKKDKKQAWLEYVRALRNGSSPEEIHGTLFWCVKTLLLSASGESVATKAGVKSFVYKKNKASLVHWEKEDLENDVQKLNDLYHRAHRGEGELELLLEKHILQA